MEKQNRQKIDMKTLIGLHEKMNYFICSANAHA